MEAIGARLLSGRNFNQAEMTAKSDSVIVDDHIARRAWPGQDAVGKQIVLSIGQFRVVGVVRHMMMRAYSLDYLPAIYQPEGAYYAGRADSTVVRSTLPPAGMASPARDIVREMDPSLAPYEMSTMSEVLYRSTAPTRFVMLLMGTFAAIALVLAAGGLFGVISYAVRTHTAEIGLRMALGAGQGRLKAMVVGRGAVLTLAGIAIGTAAVVLLSRFMASMVYGVAPIDPISMSATCALLGAIALLACYRPAQWASSVDPVDALRIE